MGWGLLAAMITYSCHGGCRAPQKNHTKHPEWYNVYCSIAYKNLKQTAQFLQQDPNNPWLRGKLFKGKTVV